MKAPIQRWGPCFARTGLARAPIDHMSQKLPQAAGDRGFWGYSQRGDRVGNPIAHGYQRHEATLWTYPYEVFIVQSVSCCELPLFSPHLTFEGAVLGCFWGEAAKALPGRRLHETEKTTRTHHLARIMMTST